MTEHTPTPWNAASAYSSAVGVPIVNQRGQRVANTALPGMPAEWDEMKKRAVVDAALICRAVNNHHALVDLVQTLLDNDPSEPVADNGMTVLDAWRERAGRVLAQTTGQGTT